MSHEVIQRARDAGIDAGLKPEGQTAEDLHRRIPYCALDTAMRVVLEHLRDKNYVTADDYGDHWNVVNLEDVTELLEALDVA